MATEHSAREQRVRRTTPSAGSYASVVPKLWNTTIESHRRDVSDAILDATATLVAEQGLLSVTMSRIAEGAGIGRATLYKYFPDIEAIRIAGHVRQVGVHVQQLTAIRDRAGPAAERLEAVLQAYAFIDHDHHGTELAALVHRSEHVAHAHDRLRVLVRDLIAAAAAEGDVRADVVPDELATYCLHAVTAASGMPSKAAVRRLVRVIVAGLRPEALLDT